MDDDDDDDDDGVAASVGVEEEEGGVVAASAEQFCASELSQQSLAPSQIHDGWMQAVVLAQFCSSSLA